MLLSAWTEATVSLPLDGQLYERWLNQKIAEAAVNGRSRSRARANAGIKAQRRLELLPGLVPASHLQEGRSVVESRARVARLQAHRRREMP